jgi:arylsulfatase A-like enzyme
MKDVPTRSPRQSRLLNVVFVLVDDWGSYDAGWREKEVGRPPVLQTPHLDKLAAHGVRLSNYYVQPICSPTRSALLSARYQIHTGLQDGIIEAHARICLPPAFGTMADAFQALSYSTHMVGKWHLGIYKEDCLPWNRGFDSFYGFLTGSEHHYTKVQRIPRGSGNRSRLFPDFRTQHGPLLSDCLPPTPSPLPPGNPPPAPPAQADEQQRPPRLSESKPGCYSTNVFTSEAVRIISDHHAGRRRTTSTTATPPASRPLFLYLALQAVHEPIEVPARYESIYSEAIADRTRRVYAGPLAPPPTLYHCRAWRVPPPPPRIPAGQSAPSSPTLQGMVSAVDECLANVSSALAAASATDSTITVVSSDNGGWNGFGGAWQTQAYRARTASLTLRSSHPSAALRAQSGLVSPVDAK